MVLKIYYRRMNMQISTERLKLIPLKHSQLSLLVNSVEKLEKQLQFTYDGESLDGFIGDIYKGQLEKFNEEDENYIWHSFFLIILKSSNVCIGSANFKNIPDEKNQVEIGYGISKGYWSKGYMTEAVYAMVQWALKEKGVSAVIAKTDKDNIASQKVLLKAGFEKFNETEQFYYWKTN